SQPQRAAQPTPVSADSARRDTPYDLAASPAEAPAQRPGGFAEREQPPLGNGADGGVAVMERQQAIAGVEPSGKVEPPPFQANGAGEAQREEFPLGVARAQVFENYIVAQTPDAMVLVDQHAAHERLVYEKIKAEMTVGPVAAQRHLIPVVVELAEDDCIHLEEAAPSLQKLGLGIERFGPRTVAVHETPAVLGQPDVARLVRDVADQLAEWDDISVVSDRLDAVAGRMACHGSVRSGRLLRAEEMNRLLRDMEKTPHSGQCIHGRPTYVELKKSDIERLFGRK
ncbi:MAG TPA: DNA mismatch repair protein MutL, partial [Devosiaceae bacterium]|nr:DNA mismatch repair protein MutL [Devosiaceae bacterium]